jgi:tRNA G10  N-methylase Trm11
MEFSCRTIKNHFRNLLFSEKKIHLSEVQKYVCVLSFATLSWLELSRIRDSGILDFQILASSKNSVLIQCQPETAKRLASRTGGIYKVGKVCGTSPESLQDCLPLPDTNKFNWTISGYECDPGTLELTKDIVAQILKDASLGKSRFIHPDVVSGDSELKLSNLLRNVLIEEKGKRVPGVDVIVDCSLGGIYYGYTQFPSDIVGFKERDLSRPYQDPTATLSPRLARTLVNLCGLPQGKTLLDPFCGLGTILQEGLLLSLNVVGIDISSSDVARCRENLDWFRRQFKVSSKVSSKISRGNSLRSGYLDLPRVDGIATEPILIPTLERNPSSEKASEIISTASEKYREAFRAFSTLLLPGGRVSIVTPELIDERGRSHPIDLNSIAPDYGFALNRVGDSKVENPCSVPTTKKKIIRRRVYLWKFDPRAS